MDGQVISSARILGLELLGEEDLFKRCLPDHPSFAFEVLNDEDLNGVPEDVAASWWAGMQAALFEGAPSPAGRAMTSGSTRAR